MTSRFLWLFLLILLDSAVDHASSMSFRHILLVSQSSDGGLDPSDRRDQRNVDTNFDSLNLKELTKVGIISNDTHVSSNNNSNASMKGSSVTSTNGTAMFVRQDPDDLPVVAEMRECSPCVFWQPPPVEDASDDEVYHPNLTIIPMGGVFMFMVCLVIKFIHWCNEDIRLADERYMKISVPIYVTPTDSPQVSPAKHHQAVRRMHRRSSVSVAAHAKFMHQHHHHTLDDDVSNTNGTSSEDITVIYNDKSQRPVPAAAATSATGASIGKSMSQKMGLIRSPNRYLRRQASLNSSNTTLSSSLSSRAQSLRTRTTCFQDSSECPSPSSLSHGHAESYLDITSLICHSRSSETPFTQHKLAFRTHLLTPPLLHFQVSSVHTSTTSLGDSIPSFSSKPSMCDSSLTDQVVISEDGESCENDNAAGTSSTSTRKRPRPIYQRSASLNQQTSGMMFLAGSYYEDPLIIECSYMEVDEVLGPGSEPTMFTLGSPSPSPSAAASSDSDGDADGADTPQVTRPSKQRPANDANDSQEGDSSAQHPSMDISNEIQASNMPEASDSSSDCNSESELTGNGEEGEFPPKGMPKSSSFCSNPSGGGAYRGMDPSLYYKLSVESNASTGSLQSPESLLSDSTSVCSSEVALLRRVNPSAALRPHNPKDGNRLLRRERVSLNGMTYYSQHGGRRIQNGKVMRMCRSWCLGDKASAIYGQLRRGQIEKECYM